MEPGSIFPAAAPKYCVLPADPFDPSHQPYPTFQISVDVTVPFSPVPWRIASPTPQLPDPFRVRLYNVFPPLPTYEYLPVLSPNPTHILSLPSGAFSHPVFGSRRTEDPWIGLSTTLSTPLAPSTRPFFTDQPPPRTVPAVTLSPLVVEFSEDTEI